MSRKPHKVDPVATHAAAFMDKRSYITLDGKEFLFGEDMKARRLDVFERDGYICQICHKPCICDDAELDHFPITRGRGGDDSITNLRAVHGHCHRKVHVRPQWTPAKSTESALEMTRDWQFK